VASPRDRRGPAVAARADATVRRQAGSGEAGVGWSLEKVGRLKLNGSLRGYSPLSRLVELEGLWTGVEGKRSLWRALLSLPDDPRLDKAKLADLESRARAQLDRIDEHRNTAAVEAFAV
jgi:hypothetical protein